MTDGWTLSDDATDWAVLASLLDGDCVPWSTEEIAREIGDHPAVTDSLKRLHRAGLVHVCDDFAFPRMSGSSWNFGGDPHGLMVKR